MIYTIVMFGDPVMKKEAKVLEPVSIDVIAIAEVKFATVYAANGVGTADP